MRYFVIANDQGPIALVTHDYQRGSYICRPRLESFASVFEAQVEKLGVKYVRESHGLRAMPYTAQESEWIDDLLTNVLACNDDWRIELEAESSGSNLTVDDLVAEHLSI